MVDEALRPATGHVINPCSTDVWRCMALRSVTAVTIVINVRYIPGTVWGRSQSGTVFHRSISWMWPWLILGWGLKHCFRLRKYDLPLLWSTNCVRWGWRQESGVQPLHLGLQTKIDSLNGRRGWCRWLENGICLVIRIENGAELGVKME